MEAGASGEEPMTAELADDPSADSAREGRALTTREWVCVGISIVAADLTLFRGHGYAGIAAMAAAAIALLWLGKRRIAGERQYLWITAALVVAAAIKLAWGGSVALAAFAGLLVCAFAATLDGRPPYLVETLGVAFGSVPAGVMALVGDRTHRRRVARGTGSAPLPAWLTILLPLGVVVLFGAIFVMANPDLAESVRQTGRRAWAELSLALQTFSVEELFFWLLAGALTLGLLRPLQQWFETRPAAPAPVPAEEPSAVHLTAYRNTLLAAIALFAIYLAFEFRTLWFREFPEGFYYAGYAHQGAAWLTIALALTTVILSVMFQGDSAHRGNLARLRPLAWTWSIENLILAAAVYNRLGIYIQFNGMTRMRVIGLLGITAVVVGLLLMLRRLARGHGFLWLVQRYIWTVALAVFCYLLLPVDMLVHAYNTRRVLDGDLPPVVQIVAHPIDSGGVLVLPRLLDSQDPVIREGVRAMLAERHRAIRRKVAGQHAAGWSARQISDEWLERHLDRLEPHWAALLDDEARRRQHIERFREYAMQWY